MSTVKLSFNSLNDSGKFQIYIFDIPIQIQKEIIQELELPNGEIILSFSRFVDFNKEHHGKIIDSILSNIGSINPNWSLDDYIFVCAVFHNLNLKKYLIPAINLAMINFGIGFDELKEKCKSDTYKMGIFGR